MPHVVIVVILLIVKAILPAPEIIAREIVEDLTAALVEFEAVASALEAQQQPSAD